MKANEASGMLQAMGSRLLSEARQAPSGAVDVGNFQIAQAIKVNRERVRRRKRYADSPIVYALIFVTNENKMYIGKTILKPGIRRMEHIRTAKNGGSYNVHKAIRKYGEKFVKIKVLAVKNSGAKVYSGRSPSG